MDPIAASSGVACRPMRTLQQRIEAGQELSCVNDFYAACCLNSSSCERDLNPDISEGEWLRCLDAVDSESCGDLDNGNVPVACLGF